MVNFSSGSKTGGEIQISTEEFIQQKLKEERIKLEEEAGLEKESMRHFQKPVENLFTKDQREHTTLLFGGLTWKHEKLIQGALEGLGYKIMPIPTPDVAAFQLGKEYGNNGQCNPTYFTVGNLVQYLQYLEQQGMSKKEIIDKYIFLTAGACGPCRFGMYEAEYRLALRNAGFDGFRVHLFQQSGGLNQAEAQAGLEMNLDFFMAILNGMNMGDLLGEVAHQIRPYEVNPGETDRVMEECMEYAYEVMKKKKTFSLDSRHRLTSILKTFGMDGTVEYIGKFLDQLFGDEYTSALNEIRDRLNQIEIDRTRVKPIVKITGEFWAQTTEGDGNFNMFRFLDGEGAQLIVEPVGTWIMYMIHQAKQEAKDRSNVKPAKWWELGKRYSNVKELRKKYAILTLAEKIFSREYHRLLDALGGTAHHLVDQYELQRAGHPFYNSRAGGGEGHLEVAKNIYYSNHSLAHMVLSLKPFGCMPSTQSDGAQAAVVSLYKDMIYLPIETSGEGEINAHSRVQMALGEARAKARLEFKNALDRTGFSLDEIKAYVNERAELKRAIYEVPRVAGVVGEAANFVLHVADLMKADKSYVRPEAAKAVA